MTEETGELTLTTLQDNPHLAEAFFPQKERIWPQFMFHDVYANRLWSYVTGAFAAYQLYLLDSTGAPVAVGQAAPLPWDGTLEDLPVGWADGLVCAAAAYDSGQKPNTLAALEIAIQPEYRGQGVSYRMIQALRGLAQEHEFQAMIVAVRPSWKARYPITPMEQYVRWTQPDGAPFDPWLRAHWRSGGEILHVAHPSMIIRASVGEWEEWTGMRFPTSGDYVVPGALVPVHIDRAMNSGLYVEPNVWVHHPLTTKRLAPA